MRVVHEKVLSGESLSISCRDFALPTFDCPYHRHPEIEILRIDESRGRILAGDFADNFQPGEIYLFGSNLPHAFINTKGTTLARSRCLQFDPKPVFSSLEQFPEARSTLNQFTKQVKQGLRLPPEKTNRLSLLLDDLFSSQGLALITRLFTLLHHLSEIENAQPLASSGYSLQTTDRHLEQLETVLSHIHHHSTETLLTSQLAQLAGMSESSFHRHFRQRIGRTPNAYLQAVRLSNVAQRLLESNTTISEIAFSEGFNNLSNFNLQFQRTFQCTPRQYRHRHQTTS